MVRKNPEDYTTIELTKKTKKKLRKFQEYPKETDEKVLLRLIKNPIRPVLSDQKTKRRG